MPFSFGKYIPTPSLLAADIITKRDSVRATTNGVTLASGAWTDLTDMTIAFTKDLASSDIIAYWKQEVYPSGGVNAVYQRLDVDAGTIDRTGGYANLAFLNKIFTVSGMTRITGLAAGAHTFKVQWALEIATDVVSVDGSRELIVIEVKK